MYYMNLKLGCGFKDFGQMIATKPPVGHPKMCLSNGILPKNADKGIIGKFAQIMLPTQTMHFFIREIPQIIISL